MHHRDNVCQKIVKIRLNFLELFVEYCRFFFIWTLCVGYVKIFVTVLKLWLFAERRQRMVGGTELARASRSRSTVVLRGIRLSVSVSHRCNKHFLTFFYSGHFFTFLMFFFKIFSTFFILKKNLVKSKVCKNPTKNILRRWLSNDFLLILVRYLAYTAKYLTCWRALKSYKFGNLTTYIWLSVQR